MKRGSIVRLVCKAHDLVVVGSNPTPASIYDAHTRDVLRARDGRRNIVLAVYWHKNQRNNVEKNSSNRASFLKRTRFAMYSILRALSPRLATSNVALFNIPSYGGV